MKAEAAADGDRLRGGRAMSWWWRRRSLRARLTAAATLVIAIGMALAAVLLVYQVYSELIDGLNNNARQRAQEIAATVHRGQLTSRLPATGEGAVAQVVDPTGRVVASSVNVSGNGRLFFFSPSIQGDEAVAHTVASVPLGEDDDPYQVVALAAGRGGHTFTVYAGLPRAEVDHSMDELTTALLVTLPALTALLAVVGWLLVGRAIRPVETLRAQAAEITATDLNRRLTLPAADDEIHRLGSTLNDLLARLEASTNQQRQFVADAAHELRSPLAALRAQIEVAAAHPDQAGWAEATPDLLDDTARLSRLVDDLVRLARLDASRALRCDPVDLDEIVFAEARRGRLRAPVPIDTSRVSAARISGDRDGLRRIVQNLLDNAVRHASGQVAVSLTAEDGQAELAVADDGPGIPAPDRERVFERFTRLDGARSRDAGGSGLGLAIVRELAHAHGGQVWIEDNDPGTRLRVRLPTVWRRSVIE
ncbi:MAG: ATP-binding protein [Streptosporangiaceae bacterium]